MKKSTKGKGKTEKDEKRKTKLVRTGLKCGYDRDRSCWDPLPPGYNGVPDAPGAK